MTENFRPWTIKNIPNDLREATKRAAKKDNMDIGVWLAHAIRNQIQADRKSSRAVIAVSSVARPVDLEHVGRVIGMIKQMMDAGCQPPKNLQRKVSASLRRALETADTQSVRPKE